MKVRCTNSTGNYTLNKHHCSWTPTEVQTNIIRGFWYHSQAVLKAKIQDILTWPLTCSGVSVSDWTTCWFSVFVSFHSPFSCPFPQESFTDDCKFRERFQENSYNTYASVIHKNHRTGREWFVALNKRGKAKMGSSPRVKSQHVSTHFLPRTNSHEKAEQGFTITDKEQEKQPHPPTPSITKVAANTGKKNRPVVKYWPKFRFG